MAIWTSAAADQSTRAGAALPAGGRSPGHQLPGFAVGQLPHRSRCGRPEVAAPSASR